MQKSSLDCLMVEDMAAEARRIANRVQFCFWLLAGGCGLAALGMILATLRG